VIDKMNTAIYRALGDADIDMAMPQREIYLQGPLATEVQEVKNG
jgi:small-conductance mechanosensitive channel